MRKWGKRSKRNYDTLDPRLQFYLDWALQEVADISLICGHRGQKEQNEYYYGSPQRSKLPWPKGRHNKLPSMAVDFQPWPMPNRSEKLWASLAYIAGRIIQRAAQDDVVIRWGGDWDGDGDLTDQNFDDLFHIEIKE